MVPLVSDSPCSLTQAVYVAVGFGDEVLLSVAPGTCPAPWYQDAFMDHTT